LPPDNPNYELVFEDNFDSIAMDQTKWYSGYPWNQKGYIDVSYCYNFPDSLLKNDLYGYRKRNFENCLCDTTGTGQINIISIKENYTGIVWAWPECSNDSCIGLPCDSTYNPPICFDIDTLSFNYTTNMLRSKELFKYGYFEIRCKISKPNPPMNNTGIGPNFWLWGANSEVGWSEIDIFEFNGNTNSFASTIHYEDIYGDTIHGIPNSPGYIEVDFNDFHIFSINWTPEKIDFYLDGECYVTSYEYSEDLISMPMIIDVNFPLHTMCQFIDSTTQLPHDFIIDYVRVYQLISDCSNDYQICDFSNIEYKHYRNIYVGDSSCVVTIPQNEIFHLIYSKKIYVSPNFILEDGASINFERTPCFSNIHITDYPEFSGPAPPSFFRRQNPIFHEY